jgi:DNA-binding LacI/PurR family transcriptional regulator
VIVGTPDEPHGIPCVDFDFDQGARDCVGHLIGLGHRRIGYLGQPQETYELGVAYATHARDAMLSALAEHGCDAAWTPCATDRDPVADALDDLYAALPGMTALIVYNEGAVPLVLDRLTALGLEVPGDISVIGLCPDDEAERCRPPLTSVTLPAEHLAATAVRDLARRVKGEELSPRTLLSPELKPRSSTAPARS